MILALAGLACQALSNPSFSPDFSTMTPAPPRPTATEGPPPTERPARPTEPPAAAATAATSAPTDAPTVETYLGDVVERDGYALAALAVQDPAEEPGFLYLPRPGTRLVAIEVELWNVSGEPALANGSGVSLRDESGRIYQPDDVALDRSLGAPHLQLGERTRGWVAFHLPDDAQPESVRFTFGFVSGVEIQVNLAPAPEGHARLEGSARVKPDNPPFGEVVEQEGYSLVALQIADPAPPTIFYQAQPDLRLVAVELELSNISGEALNVTVLNSSLVDGDGYVHPVRLGAATGEMAAITINPGERVRGWVAFAVPANASLESVKYRLSVVPDVVLRAGLEP